MHGTKLKLADFHSYIFHEVAGCKLASMAEGTERVYEFHASAHFDNIRPLPGALEALREESKALRAELVDTKREGEEREQVVVCTIPMPLPLSVLLL